MRCPSCGQENSHHPNCARRDDEITEIIPVIPTMDEISLPVIGQMTPTELVDALRDHGIGFANLIPDPRTLHSIAFELHLATTQWRTQATTADPLLAATLNQHADWAERLAKAVEWQAKAPGNDQLIDPGEQQLA